MGFTLGISPVGSYHLARSCRLSLLGQVGISCRVGIWFWLWMGYKLDGSRGCYPDSPGHNVLAYIMDKRGQGKDCLNHRSGRDIEDLGAMSLPSPALLNRLEKLARKRCLSFHPHNLLPLAHTHTT